MPAPTLHRPTHPHPIPLEVASATSTTQLLARTRKAEDTARRAEDRLLCVVCAERERRIVLLPCRHCVLCRECASVVAHGSGTCPMCRCVIKSRHQINLA